MIIVPKRNKRKNQRKLKSQFRKDWTRITGWLTLMPKVFRIYKFFVDAPPIPRLVDLVHAFNGVVVEQFKERVEKLLSDSILLWRLLKLLFKFLQMDKIRVIALISFSSYFDWSLFVEIELKIDVRTERIIASTTRRIVEYSLNSQSYRTSISPYQYQSFLSVIVEYRLSLLRTRFSVHLICVMSRTEEPVNCVCFDNWKNVFEELFRIVVKVV